MTVNSNEFENRLHIAHLSKSEFGRALHEAQWFVKCVEKDPELLGYAKDSSRPYVQSRDNVRDDLERTLIRFAGLGLHEALTVFNDNDSVDLVIYDRYHDLMQPKSMQATVEEVMSARRRFSRSLQPVGAAMRAFSEGRLVKADFDLVIGELEAMGARRYYHSPQHVAHMGRGSGSHFGGDIKNLTSYAQALSFMFDRGIPNLLPHLARAPDFDAFKKRESRNPENYRNAFPAAMVLAHDKTKHDLETANLPLSAHGVIFSTLMNRIQVGDFVSIEKISNNFDLSLTFDALAREKPVICNPLKPLRARKQQFTPLALISVALSKISGQEDNWRTVLAGIDTLMACGLKKFVKDPAHLAQLTMSGFRDQLEKLPGLSPQIEQRIPFRSLTSPLTALEVFNLRHEGVDAAYLEYDDRVSKDREFLRELIPRLGHDQQEFMFKNMAAYKLKPDDRRFATASLVVEDRLAFDLGL
jgi:hypothetical protein